MTDSATAKLWENAQQDAMLIMGRAKRRPGRPSPGDIKWLAQEDPLAWWCLTELLVSYGTGEKS